MWIGESSLHGKSSTPIAIICCCLLVFMAINMHADTSEIGLPYIQNYTPSDYRAHFQNWAIAQDKDGLIYVANNDGLLVYDGVNWRKFLDDGNFFAFRSLVLGPENRMYVGTANDFGFLEYDSLGQPRLVSFLPHADEKHRKFNDVWYTLATDNAVYYMTHFIIFIWQNESLTTIECGERRNYFHTAFEVDGEVYVRQDNKGLFRITDGQLDPVPGGEIFADRSLQMMERYDNNTLLLSTASIGFYLMDAAGIRPFASEALKFTEKNQLYSSTRLSNGNYVLGTRRGGMAVIDRAGNMLAQIDNRNGLQDNSVWGVFEDQQGNVWAALNNGISKLEVNSPLTHFGDAAGQIGVIERIRRVDGKLYLATNLGTFYINSDAGNEQFQRVKGIDEFTWTLFRDDNTLLAGTHNFIFEVRDGVAQSIKGDWQAVFDLTAAHNNADMLWVAQRRGIATLYRQPNGRWKAGPKVEDADIKAYEIVSPEAGLLWIEAGDPGITRVEIENPESMPEVLSAKSVAVFDTVHGLPTGRIFPILSGEQMRFATEQGLYKFDRANERFLKLSDDMPAATWRYLGNEDPFGRLWISRSGAEDVDEQLLIGHLRDDKTYQWDAETLSRIRGVSIINTIYTEPDSITWIASSGGLMRFDGRQRELPAATGRALIRRIIVNNDSTIQLGPASASQAEFSYSNNTLRFEFALPAFSPEGENQFQTKLDGYQAEWSDWGSEAWRDFTWLEEGDYVFRVRGRDVRNQKREEARFAITILPPWYRSTWAWIVWGLLLAALIYGIVRLAMKLATERARELSKLREAELVAQKNSELGRKNETLKELLQELRSAQAKVLVSENRFRAVAQSANDAIITVDQEGKISYLNGRAADLFGLPENDGMGNSLTSLLPSHYHRIFRKRLRQIVADNDNKLAAEPVEMAGLRQDGEEFPIELTLARWSTQEGVFITGIIRDITQRKAEQNAIREALDQLEAEDKRKSEELEKARQLQLAMLPAQIPQVDGLEIDAYMETAIEVGGDYYDLHVDESGSLTAIVGDATGHGSESGMLVAATKSLLASLLKLEALDEIFKQANRVFRSLNLPRVYMALQMVRIIDKKVQVCSAGMPPLYIYRAKTGEVEEILIKAMPLGGFANFPYQMRETSIETGDVLVLMSDGFPERFNAMREQFEFENVAPTLAAVAEKSPSDIIQHLVQAGNDWAAGFPQNDDVTFVVIKVC